MKSRIVQYEYSYRESIRAYHTIPYGIIDDARTRVVRYSSRYREYPSANLREPPHVLPHGLPFPSRPAPLL